MTATEQATPELHRRRVILTLAAGLLIACLCLVLFGFVAEEMWEGETLHFDTEVRDAIHAHASPGLTSAMRIVTDLGSPAFLVLATAAAFILLWRSTARHRAILLLVTMAGGGVLLAILKHEFHRTRPDPFFGVRLPTSYSFPSGHSLLSFCFYGILATWLAMYAKSWSTRVLLMIGAISIILAVGLSRIYLGVHYPSDVIAGYLAATVWLIAIALAYQRWKRAERAEARVRR